jgi:hypothetical protein
LPEPADRVLAALRLVQQEIRNPGTGEQPSSYEATQPSVVFSRQYGDSKDKSLLLVAMLRALKLEAAPVLVNDTLRQELANLQPSPTLFNRGLVQVNLNGQSYWLDPTATYQRGALALRYWPNFGWGLPLGLRVTVLAPIPVCPVQPLTTVTEYLDLAATNNPSNIKIVTVAQGPDADALRARFATTPREDVERENLEGWAKLYPSIHSAAPLFYYDDEQRNRVETTESYTIDNIWNWEPGELQYSCRIHAVNVDDALVKPPASLRTMPFAVRYPVHQIFHAELNLNRALPGDMDNKTMNDPAFFFQRILSLAGPTLAFNCEYRSLTDSVAPGAVPAYVSDMDSAAEALDYSVVGGW